MVERLSQEDIQAFWEERGVSTTCPICNRSHWILNTHKLSDPTAPTRYTGLFMEDSNNQFALHSDLATLIMLVCAHCGFVRLHSHGVLAQWLAGRTQNG